MRHSTLLSILGILVLMLPLSLCALVMAPQPKPASTHVNLDLAETQIAQERQRLAENQARIDAMTKPSTASTPATEEALPTANPDGKPLAQALPWKGMPEALLAGTYLGEPDETGEVIDGGLGLRRPRRLRSGCRGLLHLARLRGPGDCRLPLLGEHRRLAGAHGRLASQ
uniref:hypothetical protein n=1 Tax=Parolsenella massiliensis TaxID=1871022 RepID=UPI0009334413|nr:hypothetical protein [Parolsenella massiliensis]